MPDVADVPPIAAFAGVRPLLQSSDSIGHASREHRVVDEAPVITIAGGKYTTFRVMARDTLAVAARGLGRRLAIHDSDDPLPSPLLEGAKDVQLTELCYQSDRERRWVTIPTGERA